MDTAADAPPDLSSNNRNSNTDELLQFKQPATMLALHGNHQKATKTEENSNKNLPVFTDTCAVPKAPVPLPKNHKTWKSGGRQS
jgi:hypothetical protein